MTGRGLYNKACEMLGYNNAEEISGNDVMLKRALTLANMVYSDLWQGFKKGEDFKPLTVLTDKLDLPNKVLQDIAPYGMAMFLAQSESDADNQGLYGSIYNQKKTRIIKVQGRPLPPIFG